MTIAQAPGAAVVGISAGVVYTLSLPPVSPRDHEILGWQHDGRAEHWVHPVIFKAVMETQALGHAQAAGSDDAARRHTWRAPWMRLDYAK